MYYIMKKNKKGQEALKEYSEDIVNLIHSLARRLLKEWKEKDNFTYKPVRVLENGKSRDCIQTSDGDEYFIMEKNNVSLLNCF